MTIELGPIRPPSEARSLLLRVTRNCPWNRCAFCPVYKGARFSTRPVKEVVADIEAMGALAQRLSAISFDMGDQGVITARVVRAAREEETPALGQVALFLNGGGKKAFLQDANSLVLPPEQLTHILTVLRRTFPTLEQVTTYAQARTLVRLPQKALTALRCAGLTRVHVGLESGSDEVLALVGKGADAAQQIEAGQRVLAAGLELSEYVMPGLGGVQRWRRHAEQTARVLSAIVPHFIRLRTTAVLPGTALAQLEDSGQLEPMNDVQVVTEIRLLLAQLHVNSRLESDHALNLLPELAGQLPQDRPRLLETIDRFLGLEPRLQQAFALARRSGLLLSVEEMDLPVAQHRALALLDRVEAPGEGSVDAILRALARRLV